MIKRRLTPIRMHTFKKLFLYIVLGCLLSNISIASNDILLPIDNRIPTETFIYASTFDNVCSIKTSYKIDPSWEKELTNQLPRWKKLWNQEGILLLKTTIALTNRVFAQKDFQVSLSLCSFPSMSLPLIINARYALRSFTEHPIPDYVFISTIYHELLHNYIESILPDKTPLLEKYQSESKGVLNHLHLLALEKAVYLHLNWKSKLKEIIAKDESLPNKDYKRAWEIINKKENYADFIAELKIFSSKK